MLFARVVAYQGRIVLALHRGTIISPDGAVVAGILNGSDCHVLKSIANSVERLNHIEGGVDNSELLAHALDVAVDGAIAGVKLFIIRCVHSVHAAYRGTC